MVGRNEREGNGIYCTIGLPKKITEKARGEEKK